MVQFHHQLPKFDERLKQMYKTSDIAEDGPDDGRNEAVTVKSFVTEGNEVSA
jgi:hypothetical protein